MEQFDAWKNRWCGLQLHVKILGKLQNSLLKNWPSFALEKFSRTLNQS